MKRAYLQAVGGVSGDMFLSALISAGVPAEKLKEFFSKLPGNLHLEVKERAVSGLKALRIKLWAENPGALPSRFPEFMAMLQKLELEPWLREKAWEIFVLIFQAEARIHGRELSEVNLHELSAYDTLGDVLGVLYGLKFLGVSEVFVSPLPLGSGLVESAHGRLPLPAPAAAEILKDVPVYGVPEPFETVTPTGAALVKALAKDFGPFPEMTIEAVGVATGTFSFQTRPNLLRLFVGKPPKKISKEEVWEIVTDLDDESPETLGYLMERLLSAGALDVGFSFRLMKKNRPGLKIEVISSPDKAQALASILLEETSTLGVRIYKTERLYLPREIRTIETSYGQVRVKMARTPSGKTKFKLEAEDLIKFSRENKRPLREVKQLILNEISFKFKS